MTFGLVPVKFNPLLLWQLIFFKVVEDVWGEIRDFIRRSYKIGTPYTTLYWGHTTQSERVDRKRKRENQPQIGNVALVTWNPKTLSWSRTPQGKRKKSTTVWPTVFPLNAFSTEGYPLGRVPLYLQSFWNPSIWGSKKREDTQWVSILRYIESSFSGYTSERLWEPPDKTLLRIGLLSSLSTRRKKRSETKREIRKDSNVDSLHNRTIRDRTETKDVLDSIVSIG